MKKINPVKYWPLFRSPEANEPAFPKGFLFGTFTSLGLWIAIIKYWPNVLAVLRNLF